MMHFLDDPSSSDVDSSFSLSDAVESGTNVPDSSTVSEKERRSAKETSSVFTHSSKLYLKGKSLN